MMPLDAEQRWQAALLAILATRPSDSDGSHDLNHLHRVWGIAARLLEQSPAADPDVVIAASYLHDLVNHPKNHPERHLASRQSATLAKQLLTGAGFPGDKLDSVGHAIEAHSFSAEIAPRTLEACIVQDADRLDALGMIGIARLFYIAGRMGSDLAHPQDPQGLDRPLDDRRYALDHIVVKLARLPATMNTEVGRVLGEQRLARIEAFREAFCEEWVCGRPVA